jgi:hypothetical protein
MEKAIFLYWAKLRFTVMIAKLRDSCGKSEKETPQEKGERGGSETPSESE